MALLGNGLETLELGSTGWREVINANLYKLKTAQEIEKPNYDIEFASNAQGPILTDRNTGDKYRLYVVDGALSIEQV